VLKLVLQLRKYILLKKLTPERRLNRESMKSKMGAALIIEFNLKKPCAQAPLVNYTQNSCKKNIFTIQITYFILKNS
jgi:hypothetical protein